MNAISVKEICDIVNGTILNGAGTTMEEACKMQVTSVIINSKEGTEGSLFVPLRGEKTDAHDYIADAYSRGTRVSFTARGSAEPGTGEMVYICVKDTLCALQELGRAYRRQFQGTLLGITGSVGKTTTKEMIASALGAGHTVLKTYGNRNSQVGVPLMMLELGEQYEYAVIEMGMSMPGEMRNLASIAAPVAAVLTNIGVAHIGQLGSQENIRKEKLTICAEFPAQGGKLFVNGEDPLLHDLQGLLPEQKQIEIRTFGLNPSCDYYADEVKTIAEYTEFLFCNKAGTMKESVMLPAIGVHNVIDAVAALGVAAEFGILPEAAKKGLELYQPMSQRGRIENLNGIILIDDTYNASPDSMRAGLDIIEDMKTSGRKTVILADVLELGELSASCHYEVGAYAAGKKIDCLVTIGTEAARIAEGALANRKQGAMQVICCTTQDEACERALQDVKPGDVVYLKGSRGMRLDLLAQRIREAHS